MKDYSDILNIKRPPLNHPRMAVENRAKQYMPMDALRGFSLAILTKQVEQEFIPRITLSGHAQELLDRKLSWLETGISVTVRYFRMEKRIGDLEIGTYVTESGPVETLDRENRTLLLPHCYIAIEDIVELESSAFDGEFADQSEVEPYAG